MNALAFDPRPWSPLRRSYAAAVDRLRLQVRRARNDAAASGGSILRAIQGIDWQPFTEAMRDAWEEAAAATYVRARTGQEREHAPAEKAQPTRRQVADEQAVQWIEQNGLRFAQHLTRKSKAALNATIRTAITDGLSVDETARLAALHVGLAPKDMAALRNFQDRQRQTGASARTVAQRTEAYRKRLVAERARMIVQTELVTAREEGKRAAWKILRDEGRLRDEVWEQEWTVVRPCPLCAPMAGQRAPLGGMFRGPRGWVRGAPLHVRCQCGAKLVRRRT